MTAAWPSWIWTAIAAPVANHLWQSTLFAAAAGLLTLTLSHHRAQLRHGIWLAASVKFLVPFAALLTLGRHLGWPSAVHVQADMALALDAVSEPFSRPVSVAPAALAPVGVPAGGALLLLLLAIWSLGSATILLRWWVRWRRVAAAVRDASPAQGRELETLRRLERVCGTGRPVAMVSSPASFEPGIFGILRPVLVWPRRIAGHLDNRQIETVLSHELAHVRRHDNLTGAIHMVVEGLFWFHPLVWWLGARLVDERERACDEEVVRCGGDPQIYAESILTVCRLFTGSAAGLRGRRHELQSQRQNRENHDQRRSHDVERMAQDPGGCWRRCRHCRTGGVGGPARAAARRSIAGGRRRRSCLRLRVDQGKQVRGSQIAPDDDDGRQAHGDESTPPRSDSEQLWRCRSRVGRTGSALIGSTSRRRRRGSHPGRVAIRC